MADSHHKTLPTEAEILDFIRKSPTRVGKRDIARAFQIKGQDRIHLKTVLRHLKNQGHLAKDREKPRHLRADSLPPVLIVIAQDINDDGEMTALPRDWPAEQDTPPIIYLVEDKRRRITLSPGEHALVRLTPIGQARYDAHPIRRIDQTPTRFAGLYEQTPSGGRVRPVDKRARNDYALRQDHSKGAEPDELVLVEPLGPHNRREVKVIERLGRIDSPRTLSLIARYEQDIPDKFSDDSLSQAQCAGPVDLGTRDDLRDIMLVTIDGADARDFDDAVWAEPDSDSQNPNGWHVLVAIADVAHYVPAGSALDKDARERGNSTYFPDHVIPMLPEQLSNGWCSLVPHEDRPCLAVHLWISAQGDLRRHRFVRGLMRSAARLTYEQVQYALDGQTDSTTSPLLDSVLRPLMGAFTSLEKARQARGTLELNIPEFNPVLNDAGQVIAIEKRTRLDSHRLIEELMIAANVAAATELEQKACIYRTHEPPDPVKIEALTTALESLGLPLARGQVVTPKVLSRLLERASHLPQYPMVSELVLRAQAQALYSCDNTGHFGLALQRYTHFTSPIRRYSDLLVHRAIIEKKSKSSPNDTAPSEFLRDTASLEYLRDTARWISGTERRSALAERDTRHRMTAAFLAQQTDSVFPGKVNGVTKAGLFITLDENGADGLLPMRALPQDYYHYTAQTHQLTGKSSGRVFSLGDRLSVRILESNAVSGAILLGWADDNALSKRQAGPKRHAGKGSRHRRGQGRDKELGRGSAKKQKRDKNRTFLP